MLFLSPNCLVQNSFIPLQIVGVCSFLNELRIHETLSLSLFCGVVCAAAAVLYWCMVL